MSLHERYMQRCLQLAEMGAGNAAPNPMVGAVLVHDGRIVGEGYHQQYGGPHAEVNCINNVNEEDKHLVAACTLYVSLEPCAHFGKTPPCSDLIIANKIPDVVIGCRDSFASVNGKGIEKLKAAGVNVIVGILEDECIAMNKRFFTFHNLHRPYIILKWAQSSDGKIAGEGSARTFISNELSNRLVHKWRSEEQAILVGTNTALLDDPALSTRNWPGNDPARLVIDTELKLPHSLQLFDGSIRTVVFNYHKNEQNGLLQYYLLKRDENLVTQLLSALYGLQLQSLIVEGGAKLLQSFIDGEAWDEARVICNEQLTIGKGLEAPQLKNGILTKEEKIGSDMIRNYRRKKK